MILSRCHKQRVYVHCGNEGLAYYVCTHCKRSCDTIASISLGDHGNDAGINEVELAQAAC